MSLNRGSAINYARNAGKVFYGKDGRIYRATRLYDEKGKFHGCAIYQKDTSKEDNKISFQLFIHKDFI